MAWYYENGILSTTNWFTYHLKIKHKKENQLSY